jgi:hypothetical protein
MRTDCPICPREAFDREPQRPHLEITTPTTRVRPRLKAHALTPVSPRGTDEYVEKHYSGRTWNELIAVLSAAGIVVGRSG